MRQRKNGHLRPVTSLKRFNSYEIFYDGKGKGCPFKTGDLFKEVQFIWNILLRRAKGWPFKKRGSIHMKFSMMRQENGDLLTQVTAL